jgi:hypothetical protein
MYPRRDRAKTSGSATVGTTSAVIVADNPNRLQLTITNDHATQIVYLAFATSSASPTAVSGSGVRLSAAGGQFTTNSYTGPVAAIASGAGTGVTITEM